MQKNLLQSIYFLMRRPGKALLLIGTLLINFYTIIRRCYTRRLQQMRVDGINASD